MTPRPWSAPPDYIASPLIFDIPSLTFRKLLVSPLYSLAQLQEMEDTLVIGHVRHRLRLDTAEISLS